MKYHRSAVNIAYFIFDISILKLSTRILSNRYRTITPVRWHRWKNLALNDARPML